MVNRKMKDVPLTERPYEKCLKNGAESLSDAELLAVMLRTGCEGLSVSELSMNIVKMCEKMKGLKSLSQMQIPDFMKIKGIGKVKAVQLKCITEFAKRLWRSEKDLNLKVCHPSQISEYYMEELRNEETESAFVVFLNGKNRFLGDYCLSKGTVNASLVSTREIFRKALQQKAVYIMLVHNHPSGDPTPSKEDIYITYKVMKAGKLMDIPLLDHVIIGDGTYVSLKENGCFERSNYSG
ncbi:JAB domain-containing protein [bacterium C-53]|nr:JAB domain-containing protein [Lachnospiraceae bacterium]NBI01912.1 JAB domain-containing protein [Lachnospiraceae bacterium]RKJ12315.1 JAB domain-containing protein [bacterium C-53]